MRIAIMGLGAIGSNLAMSLIADCKEHKYYLIDHDKVEPRNLQAHTQAYLSEQMDIPKARALRTNLYNLLGAEVTAFEHRIGKSWLITGSESIYDLIIDCLDNHEGRKILSDYSRKFQIDCIHVGFSPQFTFEICWDETYIVPEDATGLDICQLAGASSFVKYVAALASSVIQDFLRNDKKRNLIGGRFSIREL